MGKGGLAFLQKKKWHPGTFKNIERTWAAQEEHERQEKQKKLNVVKLKEERYLEELKRLQVQEGLIPSSALDRMPWMYEYGNRVQDSKTAEEFLTGKIITQADIEGEQDEQRFKAVVQEEKGNLVCEEFNRLHEDPLFLIRQEELKQQQKILSNPIQMKNIHEELKQKIKKEKKHGKHRKHNKHSKSRSQSKERKHKERKERKEKKHQNKLEKKLEKAQKKEEKQNKHNQFYEDYLKKRLGENIVTKDINGQVKLDFNYYKRKLNTSMIAKKQLTQQEQLQMVEEMKQKAEQLRKDKIEQYEKDLQKSHQVERVNGKINPQFLQQTRKEIQQLNEQQDISEIMGRNRKNYIQHLERNDNTFKK